MSKTWFLFFVLCNSRKGANLRRTFSRGEGGNERIYDIIKIVIVPGTVSIGILFHWNSHCIANRFFSFSFILTIANGQFRILELP